MAITKQSEDIITTIPLLRHVQLFPPSTVHYICGRYLFICDVINKMDGDVKRFMVAGRLDGEQKKTPKLQNNYRHIGADLSGSSIHIIYLLGIRKHF